MKLAIFPQFGALNSVPVFAAFSRGARKLGHDIVEHDLNADAYVIWSVLWNGRMLANQEIWQTAKKLGKPVIILEVGGLIRGTTWRIGINHINANGFFGNENNLINSRAKKLGITLQEWQNTGKNILIFGQHSKSEQWKDFPEPEIWLRSLIKNVKKFTNRPIIFRPHPRDLNWCHKISKIEAEIHWPQKIQGTYDDYNHQADFLSAHCVFSLSGNPGILAIIAGIPVFSSPDSLAYPVSTKNFENIETPHYPDRTQWLEQICHTEWTLEEIEQGIPLSRILS